MTICVAKTTSLHYVGIILQSEWAKTYETYRVRWCPSLPALNIFITS